MSALTIMLVRHAEKPGGDFPGPGLDAEGAEDDKSLVVRGWQRAGAWAALFGSALATDDYARPNVVYAAAPKAVSKDADYSRRPFETATPTADRLHLDLVTKWGVGQEAELVAEISQQTGVILVFWEHKAIANGTIRRSKANNPFWANPFWAFPRSGTGTVLTSSSDSIERCPPLHGRFDNSPHVF